MSVLILNMSMMGVFFNVQDAYATSDESCTDLFFDGFETGFSEWDTSVGAKWHIANIGYSSSKSVVADGDTGAEDDFIYKNVSTLGKKNVFISYKYRAKGLEASDDDKVIVEWSVDGSSWNSLLTITNDDEAWHYQSHNLPSGAENNANFTIRFRSHLDATSDEVWIDRVQVRACNMQTVCGNEKIEGAEQCDLGSLNGQLNSGCSASCKAECVLELKKADNIDPIAPGNKLDYQITLTNKGLADCTGSGVELKEHYDSYTSFISANPVPDSGNDFWNFGTITPGQQKVVDLHMSVSDSAQCNSNLTNKVCVWAAEFGNKEDSENWQCTEEKTSVVCSPVCGNEKIEGTEECDDGNTTNGDGCSATCTKEVIVKAYKVICENESDLPNWGEHDVNLINASTASDYIAQHPNCHWAQDAWQFQYGSSIYSGNGDVYGPISVGDWALFPSATNGAEPAKLVLDWQETMAKVWFREVLKEGYIPYAYPPNPATGNLYSAELYCDDDILNYDNMEWIDWKPERNEYYCIAFNVPKPQPTGDLKICKQNDLDGDGVLDDGEPVEINWTFYISDVAYTDEDQDGCVDVSLPYGTYSVTEEMKSGWYQTGASGNGTLETDGSITVVIDSEAQKIIYFLNKKTPARTYCGDNIQQWPNSAGQYEECDGSQGCKQDCTLITDPECAEGQVELIQGYIDYVNIGSTTSEVGHNIGSNWSGAWVKPGWGGNYGGGSSDESFRLLMGHGDGCGDTYELATFTMNAGENYANQITFEHLDGSVDDSFDVYVNNVKIGHYTAGENPAETWVTSAFDFTPVTGEFTVKLVATEPDNNWCADWGQVAFSWAGISGYTCETGSICGYKYNYSTKLGIQDWDVYLKKITSCESGAEWADKVVAYDNNGTTMQAGRNLPEKALGQAQMDDTMNFVSLGMGGHLILEFDNYIINEAGADIEVIETSYGSPTCASYPEYVKVYASQNGTDWTDLGDSDCQEGESTFELGSLSWAKYLKLVDMSLNQGDGYDVDGVRALHCASEIEIIQTATTDSEGHYCFEKPEEGDYRVEEELKAGWNYHNYYFQDISFVYGDDLEIDFYNYVIPGSITVCKLIDEDRNLETTNDQQAPEESWSFSVTKDQIEIGAAATSETNCVTFENLAPGEYTIAEEVQYGYYALSPATGEMAVALNPGEAKTVTFINAEELPNCNLTIQGYKYNDWTESVMSGWVIELRDAAGALRNTATTNDNGYYEFTGLCPNGTYFVSEVGQYGWEQVTPNDPDQHILNLPVRGDFDFTNRPTVHGCKYDDANNNGAIDEGESKMGGWGIELYECYYPEKGDCDSQPAEVCDFVASTTTEVATTSNAFGCYEFNNLTEGKTYRVNEVGQTNWNQTYPTNPNYYKFVYGQDEREVYNFLNHRPTASISGCKYNDSNYNGVIDETEEKLSGWEIRLIGCPYLAQGLSFNSNSGVYDNLADVPEGLTGYCSVITTTTTGDDGCYEFTGLTGGSYGVGEVAQSGWTQVYPTDDTYYFFSLGTGEATTTVNFINSQNCGDGNCDSEGREDCETCSRDCGSCGGGPVCGNGKQEGSEECDDGNTNNSDSCRNNCKTPKCEDSICDNGETCSSCSSDCGSCGGGGGGGGGGGDELLIINPQVSMTCTSATITWLTSKPATTRVVYDTIPHPNANVVGAPNYGYASSTVEDSNKTTGHSVLITGLVPGQTYYFRPISAASPEKIGTELTVSISSTACCADETCNVIVKGEEGAPVLEIIKDSAQKFANPGDTGIEYAITVTNKGNLTAYAVSLVDTLPVGLTYNSTTETTRNWNLGDIAPGESKAVTYKVDVASNAEYKTYVNTAVANASNHGPVNDTAELDIRSIAVLAETGFNIGEFIFLVALLLTLAGTSIYLRRRTA